MTNSNHADLPKAEFAFPGPLRDQLLAAIFDGTKTSTTGVLEDYELCNEPLPKPGERGVLVDSDEQPVGIIETTEVTTVRLAEVDLQHAIDEGEGFTTVADWRAGHEDFWHSAEMREAMNDPDYTVNDDTIVVLQRFRLVEDLRA